MFERLAKRSWANPCPANRGLKPAWKSKMTTVSLDVSKTSLGIKMELAEHFWVQSCWRLGWGPGHRVQLCSGFLAVPLGLFGSGSKWPWSYLPRDLSNQCVVNPFMCTPSPSFGFIYLCWVNSWNQVSLKLLLIPPVHNFCGFMSRWVFLPVSVQVLSGEQGCLALHMSLISDSLLLNQKTCLCSTGLQPDVTALFDPQANAWTRQFCTRMKVAGRQGRAVPSNQLSFKESTEELIWNAM